MPEVYLATRAPFHWGLIVTRILIFLAFILTALILVLVPNLVSEEYVAAFGPITVFDTAMAVLIGAVPAVMVAVLVYRSQVEPSFLVKVFLAALLVRILVGTVIFVCGAQAFFGGDAYTYDWLGFELTQAWSGNRYSEMVVSAFVTKAGAAWGMIYYVGGVYALAGRSNMLAVQFVNATLGAATAPLIFHCAYQVTSHTKVARLSALAVAFMPSLVLWSSQELKDGPVMFFLALSMFTTLRLGRKYSTVDLLALVSALLCVLAFRFYVFYMLAVAIGGAFVIGMRRVTPQSLARQVLVMVLVGLSLTFFGVRRYSSTHFESFGSLRMVQASRSDSAQSADSGFGRGNDVSTASGALSTIPIGIANLLFAPFPWQLNSIRQAITLPEMLVWWSCFPMLILGLWYSARYRLRQCFPVLLFSFMLTLAYSVFQGNVGNAYRERAQLLIFYLVFVAVGWVLMKEHRDLIAARALVRAGRRNDIKTTVSTTSSPHFPAV
jgi:hypothetical protein